MDVNDKLSNSNQEIDNCKTSVLKLIQNQLVILENEKTNLTKKIEEMKKEAKRNTNIKDNDELSMNQTTTLERENNLPSRELYMKSQDLQELQTSLKDQHFESVNEANEPKKKIKSSKCKECTSCFQCFIVIICIVSLVVVLGFVLPIEIIFTT